jgi:hypothetical protein
VGAREAIVKSNRRLLAFTIQISNSTTLANSLYLIQVPYNHAFP